MTVMTIRLRGIPGTEAAFGWSGTHTVTVNRPAGKAGGQGLGFNGGELLGLAIGGCLCNDLHYVAHGMGIQLISLAVVVVVSLSGEPLLATSAAVQIAIKAGDPEADFGA